VETRKGDGPVGTPLTATWASFSGFVSITINVYYEIVFISSYLLEDIPVESKM